MPFKHEAVISMKYFYYLDPQKIKIRDGWNPRLEFDTDLDEELKLSIIENGVLEPIEVKRTGDDIVLINGERRLRAVRKAIADGHEIKGIPALIQRHTMSDSEAMFLALATNTGKRLEPLEEAEAFNRLRHWRMPVSTIAKRMGKSAPFVYRRLLLVDASPELQAEIRDKKINLTDAEKIIKSSDGSISRQKIQTKSKRRRKSHSMECPLCGQQFFAEIK